MACNSVVPCRLRSFTAGTDEWQWRHTKLSLLACARKGAAQCPVHAHNLPAARKRVASKRARQPVSVRASEQVAVVRSAHSPTCRCCPATSLSWRPSLVATKPK
eukprot:GHRQ01024889.1.p2 GENE.GHRQ01024889.1~~GHRQ01024889.1.p2  ORF type:complete len:104 (+),score=7.64 GHRQ01024889.1:415-726(+)